LGQGGRFTLSRISKARRGQRAGSSSGVEDFLLTHSLSISLLQAAEDNRGKNGEHAESEESFVNAMDHFDWI
jgi:hypothetical protein